MTPETLPPIAPLRRESVGDILAFLRKHYGAEYYGADETYFRWLYLECPCDWFSERASRGEIPANGILDSSGEVLALHLYIPFDALLAGQPGIGVFDEEWINGTSVRGVGRRLAELLLASSDVYVGLGCNDLSEKAFIKLGFSFMPEVPRLVAVTDRSRLVDLVSEIGGSSDDVPQQTVSATKWFELGGAGNVSSEAIVGRSRRHPTGVRRSREWLQWRYDRHPYISYRFISADPQGAAGVAVVRLEEIAGTPLRNARVVDVIGGEADEARAFAAAVCFAQEQGCLLVDFSTASRGAADRLRTESASIGVQVYRNPRVPFLFQPAAYAPFSNFNAAIAAGPRAPQFDLGQFHVTKADSTQDILRRPGTGPALKRLAS